jgi:hypothetical protein
VLLCYPGFQGNSAQEVDYPAQLSRAVGWRIACVRYSLSQKKLVRRVSENVSAI